MVMAFIVNFGVGFLMEEDTYDTYDYTQQTFDIKKDNQKITSYHKN